MARTKSQIQRMILKRVASSIIFGLSVIYIAWNYAPVKVPSDPDVMTRLIFTVRWLPLSLIPLAFGIRLVGSLRFQNADTAGAVTTTAFAEELVRLRQRALQNTLEQTALHVPIMLILSTYLESSHLKLVPILVCLFVFARIAYYIGYLALGDHIGRAFGFGLTFFGNLIPLAYCLYHLAVGGANYGFSGA